MVISRMCSLRDSACFTLIKYGKLTCRVCILKERENSMHALCFLALSSAHEVRHPNDNFSYLALKNQWLQSVDEFLGGDVVNCFKRHRNADFGISICNSCVLTAKIKRKIVHSVMLSEVRNESLT